MDDMTEQQVSQLASIRGIRRVREVVSGLSSAQQEMLLKALPEWREQLQSERTASIPYRLRAGSFRFNSKIEHFNLADDASLTLEHLYLNLRLAQGLSLIGQDQEDPHISPESD